MQKKKKEFVISFRIDGDQFAHYSETAKNRGYITVNEMVRQAANFYSDFDDEALANFKHLTGGKFPLAVTVENLALSTFARWEAAGEVGVSGIGNQPVFELASDGNGNPAFRGRKLVQAVKAEFVKKFKAEKLASIEQTAQNIGVNNLHPEDLEFLIRQHLERVIVDVQRDIDSGKLIFKK